MAQADRLLVSVSPQTAELLTEMTQVEHASKSTVIDRALQTRYGLMELALRVPRDERGRLVRMAVLPEGVEVPPGAEVFRVYLPLPKPKPTEPLPPAEAAQELTDIAAVED